MSPWSAPRVDERGEAKVAQRPAHDDAADEDQTVLGEVHGGIVVREVIDPRGEQQDFECEAAGTEGQRTAWRHQREQARRCHERILRPWPLGGSMLSWPPVNRLWRRRSTVSIPRRARPSRAPWSAAKFSSRAVAGGAWTTARAACSPSPPGSSGSIAARA